MSQTAITPTRVEDFPQWYQQVVRAADLAENSDVRGCMVIKPWGYGIWELMQKNLDGMFKETGHQNAYFPLFIPVSFLEKEAAHVEGFAKECAVVTHSRLEVDDEGKLRPTNPLTEPLIVRPTSETIIGASFAKWIQSYRDLPLLINQWANVVRWEMRPRIFLRTTEFLWQEGHTVHETSQDAEEEVFRMLNVYRAFAKDYLAIPIIAGKKTESEKFPGAVDTYCIEAMMQDGKALQAGTSHFLGQNFAKASNIKFISRENREELAWTTSWGVSTRLIGALIMTHADDDGLRLPPRMAPTQIVFVPIAPNDEVRAKVMEKCNSLAAQLKEQTLWDEPLRVHIDTRDIGNGTKNWDAYKKGMPLRVEIGPKDLEKNAVCLCRRDKGFKAKEFLSCEEFLSKASDILSNIQQNLYDQALTLRKQRTKIIDSKDEFYAFFTPKNSEKPEIHGGFALTHWNGSAEVEEKIKKDLNVTIRCIPLDDEKEFSSEKGKCPFSGAASARRVIFAKAY